MNENSIRDQKLDYQLLNLILIGEPVKSVR